MPARKLFLADDSLTIQKVINLTFADEGVEVLTAADGDSAVHRIPEELPDVVLADVNMPGLNGYELCELLRQDDRTRHIPVMLLVGAFEQFDEAEAARVGANSHITKPFQSIRQLVNEVTDLIGTSQSAAGPESALASEPEAEPASPAEPEHRAESTESAPTPSDPFAQPVESDFESSREDRVASIDQGTETSSARSTVASGDFAEIDSAPVEADDIDRLYRQSIGEEPIEPGEDFPDLGIDDEMIETSYTAAEPAGDELDLLATTPAIDQEDRGSEDVLKPAFSEPLREGADSPYKTADLDPADLPEVEEKVLPVAPTPAYETVRLDPAMVDAKMAEINQRYEQIEQPPAPSESPKVGEETIRMEDSFKTKGSGDLQLEDIDLLDIPAEMELNASSPVDTGAPAGKQVVTLSPEVIDMIAQRVVEKLAEKR